MFKTPFMQYRHGQTICSLKAYAASRKKIVYKAIFLIQKFEDEKKGDFKTKIKLNPE